jgi:hypothetical protein
MKKRGYRKKKQKECSQPRRDYLISSLFRHQSGCHIVSCQIGESILTNHKNLFVEQVLTMMLINQIVHNLMILNHHLEKHLNLHIKHLMLLDILHDDYLLNIPIIHSMVNHQMV